ncbi:MAG: ribonuclease R [Acidobacteriia bacterium]|nr:ribonuclease R [Terriglobia bacterium]
MPAAGSLVAWWDGAGLALGVVAAEEKQRVRLVVAGGHEERVAPARVAFDLDAGPAPGATPEGRRAAVRRLAEAEVRIAGLAAGVDVASLWELALEAGGTQDDRTLADLALGSATGERRAAVVRALLGDGLRFVRKGSGWEPRSRVSVEEIGLQRDRMAARDAGRRAALAALGRAAAGGSWESSGSPEEKRYLDALEGLAILDLDAPEAARALAIEALEGAGVSYDRPHEGAFRLLRRIGRFASDDENLAIRRYGLRTVFPKEAIAAAGEAARRAPSGEGRADLRDLEVVTVDGPSTREIDDGLSVSPLANGGWRIGVHIADPSAFVSPGDPVDDEALARAVTHYLPDGRLPMLPEAISEDAASLVEGRDRPALSFLVDLSAAGEVTGSEILRSTIRSRARLAYDDADRAISTGEGRFAGVLRDLSLVASLREERRVAAGAIRIAVPEVDARIGTDGRIELERSDPSSPGHRVVSEAMILAGAVGARFCLERGLPAIYRRQAAPEGPLPPPQGEGADFAAARALRKAMRKGEVSLQPGPHHALGLPAYAQVTSPLRRFQDLAVHRQIATALAGKPPAYDVESLRRVAATTEASEGDGRRAERAADRYWLLRYLEQHRGDTVEAIVVETVPRPVVVLLETLLEEPVPGLAGIELRARIHLRVERVNPRAELLVLRPV